jgi:hypothetical protein
MAMRLVAAALGEGDGAPPWQRETRRRGGVTRRAWWRRFELLVLSPLSTDRSRQRYCPPWCSAAQGQVTFDLASPNPTHRSCFSKSMLRGMKAVHEDAVVMQVRASSSWLPNTKADDADEDAGNAEGGSRMRLEADDGWRWVRKDQGNHFFIDRAPAQVVTPFPVFLESLKGDTTCCSGEERCPNHLSSRYIGRPLSFLSLLGSLPVYWYRITNIL